MKEWLLSVGAIVLFTSALKLILPDGRIGKIIRSIFTFLILLVIIKPIMHIKNTGFEFNHIASSDIQIDNNYLEHMNYIRVKKIKEKCVEIAKENTIFDAGFDVIYTIDDDYNLSISKIIINLSNSVIKLDKEHIDIIERVKDEISSRVGIDDKLIEVYE